MDEKKPWATKDNWRKLTASSPLHAALTYMPAMALAGRYIAPAALNLVLDRQPPATKKKLGITPYMDEHGSVHYFDPQRTKTVGTIAGAALPLSFLIPWYLINRKKGMGPVEAMTAKRAAFDLATGGQFSYSDPFVSAGPITKEDLMFNRPSIGISTAISTIDADPFLSAAERLQAKALVQTASQLGGQSSGRGLVSTGDLVRAAIGAVGGRVVGRAAGSMLGSLFGLAPATQRRLAQAGTIAGIARATGIWRD